MGRGREKGEPQGFSLANWRLPMGMPFCTSSAVEYFLGQALQRSSVFDRVELSAELGRQVSSLAFSDSAPTDPSGPGWSAGPADAAQSTPRF